MMTIAKNATVMFYGNLPEIPTNSPYCLREKEIGISDILQVLQII